MVNVFMGTKLFSTVEKLQAMLTDDKEYVLMNYNSADKLLKEYDKVNPNILIIDDSLDDLSIEEIVGRISALPNEKKITNTILTLEPHFRSNLTNFEKINKIIYKPFSAKQLASAVESMSADFFTPDLTEKDIMLIIMDLDLNFGSNGYFYMKDMIIYYYYHPNELEFLNNALNLLSQKYNIPPTRIRDTLNSYIRSFNNTEFPNTSSNLVKYLKGCGYSLSLKKFIEKIVLYLINKKAN